MNLLEHLDKNNPHHAYLIEGARDEIVPEIFTFCESLGVKTSGNPDFCQISIDNFKIDNAFELRNMSNDKSFSSARKIFILCFNSLSLDAQNVLLRMFEEPISNTHFFLVVPDTNSLIKTLLSRFYLIKSKTVLSDELDNAEKFISMPLKSRIDFIKDLLIEHDEEDEEGNEIVILDSARSKALKFLNALEFSLHKKAMSKRHFDTKNFEQIFKVREFLRMPGSSTKTLLESVALVVPNF